jgi:hypothetical protein
MPRLTLQCFQLHRVFAHYAVSASSGTAFLLDFLYPWFKAWLVIAAILVTTTLELNGYFRSERVSVNRHILGHLGSVISGNLTIRLLILAGMGFAIGRRKAYRTI